MATIKRRINITADREVELALTRAARRDGVPVATKAAELLRVALEIEEDQIFGEIAEARAKQKNVKYLSPQAFWRKALSR